MPSMLRAASLTGASRCAVLVTSPPLPSGDTGVLMVGPSRDALFRAHSFADVPNGAGDAFSAMIAAGMTVGAAALLAASVLAGEERALPDRAATWSAVAYLVTLK